MLEAEISQINWYFLVTILEIAAVVGIISATITGIFLVYNTIKQKKVISSQTIITMLNRLRDEDFRDVFEKMRKGEEVEELNLKRYLTYLEYIAIFWDDGVLSLHHVDQIFGANFRLLNKNKQSLDILNNIPWNSDLYMYINKLRRRLV